MTANLQKISIRLLKSDLTPHDALRSGVTLSPWDKFEEGLISLGKMGGGKPPKWSTFLGLTIEQKSQLGNLTSYGLVFLKASDRWFAVTFGMGFVKLDPDKFEQNFGLKVVLNSVDPSQLKSADVRTPDENTLSRRSQTSRGSDQTAFEINTQRDILRGIAGKPKDDNFATRVAGADSLTITKKIRVEDIASVCSEALAMSSQNTYKHDFGWIDQIKHERDKAVIGDLEAELLTAVNDAISNNDPDKLALAFPVIYDPEKSSFIQFKGFRSSQLYPDLDIVDFISALNDKNKTTLTVEELRKLSVHEVDEHGRDCGDKWKVVNCLVFETEYLGTTYVLSEGGWYKIEKSLAVAVKKFFDDSEKYTMPPAIADENEVKYNARLKLTNTDYLCLDAKLVKADGATSTIEMCDFLGPNAELVHVKNKTSSSRLSHLFNQGTVSARVMKLDGKARDLLLGKIALVQTETKQTGFENKISTSNQPFDPKKHKVIYAVLSTGNIPKLPFFSLVTFRQACLELKALDYPYAFAWIEKPKNAGQKKTTPAKVLVKNEPNKAEAQT